MCPQATHVIVSTDGWNLGRADEPILIVSFDFCRLPQFGPRSSPSKRRTWSGSKLFDTDCIPDRIFEKVNLKKKIPQTTKTETEYIDCVKGKSAFEHAQNVRIYIILHMRSLIEAFALRWNTLLYQMILFADSEGPDQIAWMLRLIWAFAVRICPKTRFRMARPIRSNHKKMYFMAYVPWQSKQ